MTKEDADLKNDIKLIKNEENEKLSAEIDKKKFQVGQKIIAKMTNGEFRKKHK